MDNNRKCYLKNNQSYKVGPAFNKVGNGPQIAKKQQVSPVIKISLFTSDKKLMDKKMTEIKTITVQAKNN